METDLASPETIDTILGVASWSVIGFTLLWIVTSIVGVFHRRAYNLTYAEAGASVPVTPDFLKVDHAKRDAAIGRGKAYDQVLADRENPQVKTVKTVRSWSWILASTAAIIGFATTMIGAFEKIESYQSNLEEYSSLERLVQLVSQNPIGASVAAAVIAANLYLLIRKLQKPE